MGRFCICKTLSSLQDLLLSQCEPAVRKVASAECRVQFWLLSVISFFIFLHGTLNEDLVRSLDVDPIWPRVNKDMVVHSKK